MMVRDMGTWRPVGIDSNLERGPNNIRPCRIAVAIWSCFLSSAWPGRILRAYSGGFSGMSRECGTLSFMVTRDRLNLDSTSLRWPQTTPVLRFRVNASDSLGLRR